MTTIRRGMRVEWCSMVSGTFFHGKVLGAPTDGKWLGVALVQDDHGHTRHVTVSRLQPTTVSPRSVSYA